MSKTEIILAILSVVGFIGALPQIWGANWKDIWKYYRRGTLSWNTVQKAYVNVVDKLNQERFVPTTIIGIGRGGIVAAGLLCSELVTEGFVANSKLAEHPRTKIKIGIVNSNIVLKDTFEWDGNQGNSLQSRIEKIDLVDPEVQFHSDDKVLLVVAQHFTGASLHKSVNMILERGIPRDNIRTVAIFWHRHKNIVLEHEPDIFGKMTGIDETVPWKDHRISTNRY